MNPAPSSAQATPIKKSVGGGAGGGSSAATTPPPPSTMNRSAFPSSSAVAANASAKKAGGPIPPQGMFRKSSTASANGSGGSGGTNGPSAAANANSTQPTAATSAAALPVPTTDLDAINTNGLSFTRKQLEEIADVFGLFNYHTHNGLMRGDDLGIALRVLGLEITRDQQKGYVALYSTSDTNRKAMEMRQEAEEGASGPPGGSSSANANPNSAEAIISRMVSVKSSQNYFSLSEFIEVCEDAKDARLRAGGGRASSAGMGRKGALGQRTAGVASGLFSGVMMGGSDGGYASIGDGAESTATVGSRRLQQLQQSKSSNNARGGGGDSSAADADLDKAHTRQWVTSTFGSFGEASITASTLQKSLQELFSSIERHSGGGTASAARGGGRGQFEDYDYDDDDSRDDNGGGVVGFDDLRRRRASTGSSSALNNEKGGRPRQGTMPLGTSSGANKGGTTADSIGGAAVGPLKGRTHVFEGDVDNLDLNGILSMEPPTMEEVTAAFRDLGLDPHLGATCEDLLRIIGDSSTIL